MRLLLLLPLLYGCDSSPDAEYELGFEVGCFAAQGDAQSCRFEDRYGDGLESLTTPYSDGLYDGYQTCWEAWSEFYECADDNDS